MNELTQAHTIFPVGPRPVSSRVLMGMLAGCMAVVSTAAAPTPSPDLTSSASISSVITTVEIPQLSPSPSVLMSSPMAMAIEEAVKGRVMLRQGALAEVSLAEVALDEVGIREVDGKDEAKVLSSASNGLSSKNPAVAIDQMWPSYSFKTHLVDAGSIFSPSTPATVVADEELAQQTSAPDAANVLGVKTGQTQDVAQTLNTQWGQSTAGLGMGVMPLAAQEAVKTVIDDSFMSPTEASKTAPFVELGRLDSMPGEGKTRFLMRVAKALDAFTDATRYEACGVIMHRSQDNTWRVRLITNRSQVACVRVMFEEQGFTYAGDTIHSHPSPEKSKTTYIRLNAVDMRLRGMACGKRAALEDEHFSPGDRKNGGGYLVARGKLLYLSEAHTFATGDYVSHYDEDAERAHQHEQVVGVIDPSMPTPSLTVDHLKGLPMGGVHAAQAVWDPSYQSDDLPSTSCPKPNKR